MRIITNNHWRQFLYRNDVPDPTLQSDFDWTDELDGFIKYRDKYYHLLEFVRISSNAPFPKKYNGYSSDSFFSGILIKLSDDGEYYKIATYIS